MSNSEGAAVSAKAAAEADESPETDARPELNLDPQTEELFRFINSLKKLKEGEDLEKAGGPAVVTASSGNTLTTIALFVVILFTLGVFAYGAYVWASNREHAITDPKIIMSQASAAFSDHRYDETLEWAKQILENEQANSKQDVQDAVLMVIKSNMALDRIREAGKLVDTYSAKFEADSNASAERRGEFHHLEGELWLRLGRLSPDQRFLEAYKSDPKNFARLKDKFRYIQCLLSEPKDLGTQQKLLDELEKEVNENTAAQAKDKNDLLEQIKHWRTVLNQLNG